MSLSKRFFLGVILGSQILAWGQQSGNPPANGAAVVPGPANQTSKPIASSPTQQQAASSRTIHLDLDVTDANNQPVQGLRMRDLTLLDNGHPVQFASFQAVNGLGADRNGPVQLIVIFDLVDLPFGDIAFARQEVAKFLRQNDGHLALPVSILTATYDGLQAPLKPSDNGNTLADELAKMDTSLRPIGPSAGLDGDIDRLEVSIRSMIRLSGQAMLAPGRKLVIWLGPGWPLLDGPQVEQALGPVQRKRNFDTVVALETRLRESGICLESLSVGSMNEGIYRYMGYLKGLKSPDDAGFGSLALRVLTVHLGGQVLLTNNNLAEEMNRSLLDAEFYALSFELPQPKHPDELHTLKVSANKPGLTVRTITQYYNTPSTPLQTGRTP